MKHLTNFICGCLTMGIGIASLVMLPFLLIGAIVGDMRPALYMGLFGVVMGGISGVLTAEP